MKKKRSQEAGNSSKKHPGFHALQRCNRAPKGVSIHFVAKHVAEVCDVTYEEARESLKDWTCFFSGETTNRGGCKVHFLHRQTPKSIGHDMLHAAYVESIDRRVDHLVHFKDKRLNQLYKMIIRKVQMNGAKKRNKPLRQEVAA